MDVLAGAVGSSNPRSNLAAIAIPTAVATP